MAKNEVDINTQADEESGNILYIAYDVINIAKKHFVIFFLIMAIFIGAFFGYSFLLKKPMYRSSATFSITPLISSDAKSGTSVYKFNYVSSFAQQMSETFPYIAQSDNLRQAIQYDLDRPMSAKITADPVLKSNIVQVYIDSASPDDSYEVMKSFLKNFPRVSEYIIGDTRINIIYESKKPTEPYNESSIFKIIAFGAIAGLIVNIIVFYLWSMSIDVIRDKNDITYKLNSHSISELPHVNVKRNSKNKSGLSKISFTDSVFIEAARLMRKRIQSLINKDEKIIAITSTARREGKTITAFSLSKAFAGNGHKTLLIDMDFAGRALQKYLLKSPDSCVGISDYAASNSSLESVIKHYKENFDIAFAGNKNVKYSNTAFKKFFNEVREIYDYIIVDMPSCKIVPNAAEVADLCDNLLFVEKCGSSTVADIKSALKYVLYSKARFIGFVLNDYVPTSGGYGYGRYGYSRYGYLGGYRRYGYGYRRYGYGYGYGYRNKYQSKYFEEPEKKSKSK